MVTTIRYLAAGLVLPLLTACATRPSIVRETPASFSYECMGFEGCNSPEQVADLAKAHCRTYGKNAHLVTQTLTSYGKLSAVYTCGRWATRRASAE
jgi:hypothetical protein